jgi:uncharacterized SAM-binding protein YcdF (DUF218 family)
MRKRVARILKIIVATLLLVVGFLALRIYTYGNNVADVQADAAIVLGAAVWSDEVSPVFRERINHALDLYRHGKVRKIIFTGGQGNRDEPTEAAAAREYAVRNGIPEDDILIEEDSHTTYENVIYAKRLADSNGVKKVLIVSDPLHMKRAVAMARDIGLEAYPSPTPTTRYQGWRSQLGSLAHETYYYIGYLVRRTFTRGSGVVQKAIQPVGPNGRLTIAQQFNDYPTRTARVAVDLSSFTNSQVRKRDPVPAHPGSHSHQERTTNSNSLSEQCEEVGVNQTE